MPPIIAQLLGQPETESFDLKGTLDLSRLRDGLKLVADLVAMANTYGGALLVGAIGFPILPSSLSLFDSARIDDKVNASVEPRIGGIKVTVLSEDFVLVEVEKSNCSPHVFTRDGNCEDGNGKPISVFRKGDVYVRHSSKSERANKADFDRWFEERRIKLFENVRVIFDASPNAQILVRDVGGVPVRIDANAENAQLVFDLITTEPFRDVPQELAAGVKAWKSSRHLLGETQIYKAYQVRDSLRDHQVFELILRSSWKFHLHGYLWATRLSPTRLLEILKEVVASDVAPSSTELLHVSSLLPRPQAREIFDLAGECTKRGPRYKAKRLAPVLAAHRKKIDALLRILHFEKIVAYDVGEARKEVPVSGLDEHVLDEILGTLIEGKRQNRAALRAVEAAIFGPALCELAFPCPDDNTSEQITIDPDQTGGDSES